MVGARSAVATTSSRSKALARLFTAERSDSSEGSTVLGFGLTEVDFIFSHCGHNVDTMAITLHAIGLRRQLMLYPCCTRSNPGLRTFAGNFLYPHRHGSLTAARPLA